MPARKITRKKANHLPRTARSPRARGAAADTAPPRFSHVEGDLKLVVPADCDVSLILKLVAHDSRRYYAWWLLVGRHDHEAMTASYKYTNEDTIRCDVPTGSELSAEWLQPHLARFLKAEGAEEGDTPIIKGSKP